MSRIPYTASEQVQRALAELGRTEDVKFSPDNRRIAVAGFARNSILIIDVGLDTKSGGKRVLLTDCLQISSPHLNHPHGICFLDDVTIVVANRDGEVAAFRLPERHSATRSHDLPVPNAIIGQQWVHSPGSVAAHEIEPGLYCVLVCNNYANYVSRHVVSTAGGAISVRDNDLLLSRGIDVPDGVAISHDRCWIAISSHKTGSVCLFRNVPALTFRSEPDGTLGDVAYPHGLCFTPDDEYLLVADAARPQLHVYARAGKSWTGARAPLASIEVMDAATFERGRYNPEEGGPKGIDIDAGAQLLVATSEHDVLAFFDLPALLQQARASRGVRDEIARQSAGPAPPASDAARRNRLCACGSGKRLKHCCGQLRRHADDNLVPDLARLKDRALQWQRSGDAKAAADLYRAALELDPDEPDCLHMLGVALYALGRATEAAPLVRKAATLSRWRLPGIIHNLGLIVGARLADREPGRTAMLRQDYDAWLATCNGSTVHAAAPLVSVVLASCNHAAHVESALDSVFAQTYPNLELIVIDDGSSDGSPEIIRKKLASCPWPHRFIARDHRGTPATLNEAIALARGVYVNPLDADDRFEPTRIAIMVDAVATRGLGWGFALCDHIDAAGLALAADLHASPTTAAGIERLVRSFDTVGMALLGEVDPTICAGNLFIARALFEQSAGFRDGCDHHRDLCLRLLWHSEPGFVATPLYRRRVPREDAVAVQARRDADDLLAAYHVRALDNAPHNRFAPSRSTMGVGYLARCLPAGRCPVSSPEVLMRLDDEADRLDEASANGSAVVGDGMNIVGHFRGDLGLGESVRTLARTCRQGAIPAAFRDAMVDLGSRQSNRTMDGQLTEAIPHRNLLFCLNPEHFAHVSQRYADRGALDGRYVIGYWCWENENFPEKSRHALDRVDEIWVASDFVRDVFQRVTHKPVVKIPHAIDVTLTRPHRRAEFALPEDVFLFLFLFDFASYRERKNPRAVIEAFLRAFPDRLSRVGLLVQCAQGHAFPRELAALREFAQGDPRIRIVDNVLSRHEVTGLQSVCDAYVSLHRCESLGLAMAECMALGKPVIATAYSGNLEFMSHENSCLVDYSLIPVKPGEYAAYEPGWKWADADIDQAARHMKRIVEDADYRRRIGDRARLDIARNFSHAIAARAIRTRLAELSIAFADRMSACSAA